MKNNLLRIIALLAPLSLLSACAPAMHRTYNNGTEVEHLSDCALALKVVTESRKKGLKYRPPAFIDEFAQDEFGADFTSYIILKNMANSRSSVEQSAQYVKSVISEREKRLTSQIKFLGQGKGGLEAVQALINDILQQCRNDYVAGKVMKGKMAGRKESTSSTSTTVLPVPLTPTAAATLASSTPLPLEIARLEEGVPVYAPIPQWYLINLPGRRIMQPVADPDFVPVPINKLAGLQNLQKSSSPEQFRQAYHEAVRIAASVSGLPRKQQLAWVGKMVRERYEKQGGVYSTDKNDKYNTPYGILVLGRASCAGSARAACLVLAVLGMQPEHINPNKWKHQWARVQVDGEYWICDPFGLYVGPELDPRQHIKKEYS